MWNQSRVCLDHILLSFAFPSTLFSILPCFLTCLPILTQDPYIIGYVLVAPHLLSFRKFFTWFTYTGKQLRFELKFLPSVGSILVPKDPTSPYSLFLRLPTSLGVMLQLSNPFCPYRRFLVFILSWTSLSIWTWVFYLKRVFPSFLLEKILWFDTIHSLFYLLCFSFFFFFLL